MRNRWLAVPVLAAAAVIGLAACGSTASTSSTTPPAAPSATGTGSTSAASATGSGTAAGIKLITISGHKVLTNSQGFVLYWFAPDTPTKSNCTGSCATFWPPLTGTPSAAAGTTLSGTLGTIKRADGTTQATYLGHPLYTFKGDSSAGKDTGNGTNASGGLWWAMTASGVKIHGGGSAAPAPSTSTSSSGGYGY